MIVGLMAAEEVCMEASKFFEGLGAEDHASPAVATNADSFFEGLGESTGPSSLPSIKSSDLSARERADLANDIRKGKSADINDMDTNDLGYKDRQQLSSDVLNTKPSGTLGSGIREVLGGPEQWIDDAVHYAAPDSSASAFVHEARDSMRFNLLPNLEGVKGVIQDAIDGKVGSVDDIIGSYKASRDISLSQRHNDQYKHPVASLFGQITGSIANPAGFSLGTAMDATQLGASLIKSMPAFYKYVASPAAQGAFYGFLYGMGSNEADLTEGEFYPFLKHTAISMGMTIIGAVALQNLLGRVVSGGRKSFITGPGDAPVLNKDAALSTIATAKGRGPSPAKNLFETAPEQVQSRAADAMDSAIKYDIVEPRPWGMHSKSSSPKKSPNSWGDFRDFFLNESDTFNYDSARVKLSETQAKLGQQMDDILSGAQGSTTHDLNNIWGEGYLPKIKRGIGNMSLAAQNGDSMAGRAAQHLDDLKFSTEAGYVNNLKDLLDIRRYLSGAIKWDTGKEVTTGSSQDALRGMYRQLNSYIDAQIKLKAPGDFTTWKALNKDMGGLETFDHALRAGSLAHKMDLAQAPGYQQSVAQQANPAGALFGAIGKGGDAGSLFNAGLRTLLGPAGRIPSAGVMGSIGKPASLANTISKIMPSYTEGRVATSQDKQLGAFYIDNNGHLSPRDKMTQKHKLNTEGFFDINNIPGAVLIDAKRASGVK